MNTPATLRSQKPMLLKSVLGFLDSRTGTFAIALLFTLVMIHNYVFPLNSLLYTTGVKGQDCGQMIWNLWFANEAITSGHNPFSTNLIFYPLGANLAHHTLAAGFFPLTFLVKKLSGNDPLYPLYAFKTIILLSFTLLLTFSYLTLREIGLTRWAAFIPAIGYAFSNFYLLHAIHINHLAGFFIPLTALFLIRAYKNPASANLIIATLAAACSVYFTEFSIYIFMGALFFVLAASLVKNSRRELVVQLRAAGQRRVIVSGTIFVLILAPFMINLLRDKVEKPPPAEASHYSANLAGFFIPGRERDEAGTFSERLTKPLYGHAFAALDSRITEGLGGFETFAGFPLLLFTIVALLKSRQKLMWLCTVAGLLFFTLSLGPTLKIFGTDTGLPLPYALLMKLPPFDMGRTPVRFVVIALLFLMIVAAYGLMWIESELTARYGRRWSTSALVLLFVWTAAEAYSPIERRQPFETPQGLSKMAAGPVLNLPPLHRDGYAAMLQTFHHQPIATGYLARNSVAQLQQFGVLKTAFAKGGATFCEYVQSAGFRNIVIAPDSVALTVSSISPLELSQCPVNVVDLRERGPGPFGLVYPDGSERPVDYPPYPLGTRLDFGSANADQYLWYGWSAREGFYRWTDRGKASLIFSLDPQSEPPAVAGNKSEPPAVAGGPRLETGHKQKFTLRIFAAPFLTPGKLAAQRVIIKLNDQQVASWTLTSAEPREQVVELPAGALRGINVLIFEMPDAASPKSLGVSEDDRLLGFNVQWIEIE